MKRKSFEEQEAERVADPGYQPGQPDMEFTEQETALMGMPFEQRVNNPADPEYVPAPPKQAPEAQSADPAALDRFVSSKARTDLAYAPERAEPQQAAKQVVSAPAQEEEPVGAEPRPWWALGLRAGARAIAGVALAHKAKSQAGVDAISRLGQQNQSLADQYFKDQDSYANKVAALARKRKDKDEARTLAESKAKIESDRYNRNQGRLDKLAGFQEEQINLQKDKANPDSAGNVRSREIEDARDDKKETRAEKLARYKNSLPYKGPALLGGGGYGGVAEAVPQAEMDKALDDQFGGADKVPPALKTRMRLAGAIKNPKKRTEAQNAVLKDADTGERVRSGQDRTADRMEGNSELKERQAYMKETEAWDSLGMDLDRTDKALRDAGVDPDNYKGEDIPGRGPIENMLPNAVVGMYSDKGAAIRNTDLSLVAGRIYALSGKAINESEAQRLKDIMAHTAGWGEQEYISTYQFLKGLAKHKAARATRAYPDAASQVDARDPGPADQPTSIQAKPAREGHVKIRNKTTGQTGDYPAGKPIPDGFEAM